MKIAFYLVLLLCLSIGCNRASTVLEPILTEPTHPKEKHRETRQALILPKDFSISPFCDLSDEELLEDWGRELKIGLAFASDFDLYRAITSFKRALFLIPSQEEERKLEINYYLILAYYLGKKYTEVIYQFETTELCRVNPSFVAYQDLLLIIYDSYKHLGFPIKADFILKFIEADNVVASENLKLLSSIEQVDKELILFYQKKYCYLSDLYQNFEKETKSIRRAEALNAIFPGAGYWYVGQKQTALTAFLINAAFIAATYHFLDHGNIGAGLITLSLESGWYFGGIYGAGLAAKLYNERLYENYFTNVANQEKLFPIMMLKYSF